MLLEVSIGNKASLKPLFFEYGFIANRILN